MGKGGTISWWNEKNIYNFEELEYESLLDYRALYQYIKERLCDGKMTYIFLDEIQKVASFEKVVDSLQVKEQIDIYITGSNAYMLFGDLATFLTGRYVEISMLPLSFREYLEVTGLGQEQAFTEYMKNGGLPYIAMMDRTDEKVDVYLEGIYNTVIVRDIEDRQARRESDNSQRKITDITLLKTIARYLASVIGTGCAIKHHLPCKKEYGIIFLINRTARSCHAEAEASGNCCMI